MIQAPAPSLGRLALHCLPRAALLGRMAPFSTLGQLLVSCFDDQRLAPLFGRYATCVGGSPYRCPALLSLIWQAEAAGVWTVRGVIHRIASALADIAAARGADHFSPAQGAAAT
ncbi:hypothetical protein [Roseovarius sp. SYSU LYC5161]|uniref:hypothetical protein n=1 Tax=Roseovarius halophilus (ex Wu et al. 2025) TaxID=3376060 RepID=UPI00399C28D9